MQSLFQFIKRAYQSRELIWSMALRTLQSRYVGTLGGFVWSVLNPLMIILVYWFVFSVGFKVKPMGDVPFLVVFLCGFVAWTLFAETLSMNVSAVTGNVHLVKKMVFPTEMIPFVNLIVGLITHGIMLIILFILLFVNHIGFSIHGLQFFYYVFCLIVFCLGLGWAVAALNVFHRDVAQIVGVVLNVWFWLTPIVWVMDMLPAKYQFFIRLNPMFYIVNGYKQSFIYPHFFWHDPKGMLYFWGVSLFLLGLGGYIFKRLKPEFADVI